jgi:hypothetical protein
MQVALHVTVIPLGGESPHRSMLPTRQLSGTTSQLAYLVLLRAEIARFTHTQVARLCCSDPQLMPCGFHWRAVSSCAVLCSPDVPPVRGFPHDAFASPFRYAPATAQQASQHQFYWEAYLLLNT